MHAHMLLDIRRYNADKSARHWYMLLTYYNTMEHDFKI